MYFQTFPKSEGKIQVWALYPARNKSKVNILKVPNKTILKYGAVSVHTCKSMVINLNKLSGTKISLSITGVAGPKGGTQKKPVGLVYIGIVKGNFIKVKKFLFKTKSRKSIQNLTVKAALNLILLVAK